MIIMNFSPIVPSILDSPKATINPDRKLHAEHDQISLPIGGEQFIQGNDKFCLVWHAHRWNCQTFASWRERSVPQTD
jgi:hypothetical protein